MSFVLSLVKVSITNLNDTADLQDQGHSSIFVAPEYLTVSSSGPAGDSTISSILMGVYRLTGETNNNKPVWSRHAGPFKLFYNNGKFIL